MEVEGDARGERAGGGRRWLVMCCEEREMEIDTLVRKRYIDVVAIMVANVTTGFIGYRGGGGGCGWDNRVHGIGRAPDGWKASSPLSDHLVFSFFLHSLFFGQSLCLPLPLLSSLPPLLSSLLVPPSYLFSPLPSHPSPLLFLYLSLPPSFFSALFLFSFNLSFLILTPSLFLPLSLSTSPSSSLSLSLSPSFLLESRDVAHHVAFYE